MRLLVVEYNKLKYCFVVKKFKSIDQIGEQVRNVTEFNQIIYILQE